MDDKYKALFEGLINHVELTTKNLIAMGYKKPSRLIEAKILKRKKIGYYELANIKDLFDYGIELKEQDMEGYHKVMLRCLELEPNFENAIFHLFVYGLRKKDYDTSFKYLTKLIELDNPLYQKDNNLYLLILSRIIELPEEYQEKVAKLNVFDIYIPNSDRRFRSRNAENEIRKAFFDEDYNRALSIAEKYHNDGDSKIVYFQMLKHFVKKIPKEPKDKPYSHLEAAKNHQHLAIKEYLDSLPTLNSKNRTLKQLVDTYLEIKTTSKIPEVIPYKGNDTFAMIFANDFKKALELANTFLRKEEKPIYYLLLDINNLINEIREEENHVYTFDDVYDALINNDNYVKVLRKYLEAIDKPKYESLFLNFIKLCIYEKDVPYISFFRHLYDLTNNRLNINFGYYYKYFNEAILSKDLEVARIYLDIIKAGTDLGINSVAISISTLEYSLDKSEREFKEEQMITTITTAINEVINSKGVALINKADVTDTVLATYTRGCDNIVVTPIGDKIILRYFSHDYVDIRFISNEANAYYNFGNYEACINSCMILLNCVKHIKNFVYQLLGLSYYQLGKLEEAKKYLTIAHLSGEYNYSVLLEEINQKLLAEKEQNLERNRRLEETE